MYQTSDCLRIGVFPVKESVKSMDLTKDSQYLIATSTTFGVCIFNVMDGKEVKRLRVQGGDKSITCQMKQVEFALGDKKFLVLYDVKKTSFISIFDLKSVLEGNTEPEKCI